MLYPSLCVSSLFLSFSLSRSLSLPISLRVLFLCLCLCVSLSLSVPLSPLPLFLSLQVLQLRYGNSVRRRILIHSSEFESFLFFVAILDTQGPLILFVGPKANFWWGPRKYKIPRLPPSPDNYIIFFLSLSLLSSLPLLSVIFQWLWLDRRNF